MPQQPQNIVVYADGAASPNPGPGGYGTVILRAGLRRELSGGFRLTTNNRMEIFGAIAGLREAGATPADVTVHSDSRYLVDMFNGGHAATWRRNNWTRNRGKDPALNPDLWNELLNLATRHTTRFVWVKSHADNPENNRCDELAVLARQAAGLPPDPGYERVATPAAPCQLDLFDYPSQATRRE